MIKKEELSVFVEFMEGYFHQDWDIDHKNYESVWGSYLKARKEYEPEKTTELINEITSLLQNSPKELIGFMCDEFNFCLPTEKETVDWLQSLHAYLLKGISGEK